MRSTFSGLELARRALEVQQTALNTTGHNIANANTPGYTRQIPNLVTTIPDSINSMGHNLSVGTGVNVKSIERARDSYVDNQYRYESSSQQYWQTRENNLGKIEEMLNEPSDYSLSQDMTAFWNSWSELATNPENLGSRTVVLERAATLADTLHHIDQQITNLQEGINSQVRVQVQQINSYATQIRDLNNQIKRAEVQGDSPNDLKDKRDTLVDELSKIVNVRVEESKDATFTDREVGIYKLYIGDDSKALVNDMTANQLKIVTTDASSTIEWTSGESLNLGKDMGSLQANLSMIGAGTDKSKENEYLNYLRDKYDELAQGLAKAVNNIHRLSVGKPDESGNTPPTGFNFFTDGSDSPDSSSNADIDKNITAANITINKDLTNDPWKVASGKDTYGDGKAATVISSFSSGWLEYEGYLQEAKDKDASLELDLSNPIQALSFVDYYSSAIAEMGVDVQQATRMRGGQDVLVTQMMNQRESLSGVSLDEEMTNLIKYQKSYSAAARVVTMLDEMLDKVVNGMGVTR